MSNKKYGIYSVPTPWHFQQMQPSDFCNVLLNDLSSFIKGDYTAMQMVKITCYADCQYSEQFVKMLKICDEQWREYCLWHGLPRECYQFFKKQVKRKWNGLDDQIFNSNGQK